MTAATKREANKITRTLLEKHLIAYTNILSPVESLFWWLEKIDKVNRFLVPMKSEEKLSHRLSNTIKEMHNNETPEILKLPLNKGWPPYLLWSESTLRPAKSGEALDG